METIQLKKLIYNHYYLDVNNLKKLEGLPEILINSCPSARALRVKMEEKNKPVMIRDPNMILKLGIRFIFANQSQFPTQVQKYNGANRMPKKLLDGNVWLSSIN